MELPLALIARSLEFLDIRVERLEDSSRLLLLAAREDHPHGKRVAIEGIHEFLELRIFPLDREPKVLEDRLTVLPALLALESAERKLSPLDPEPVLLAAARDQDLGAAAAELFEESKEEPLVLGGER